MYSKIKNKEILSLLQKLYQQEVITKEEKNEIVEVIQRSFVSKSYFELKLIWDTLNCKDKEKEYLLDEFYRIIGGN